MARIRILIADDHAVLRTGLRDAHRQPAGPGRRGRGERRRRGRTEGGDLRPDIALVDISMPGSSGIKAIERIREAAPTTRVVVLTMHDMPAYLRAALAAGASATSSSAPADSALLAAIRDVYRGPDGAGSRARGERRAERARRRGGAPGPAPRPPKPARARGAGAGGPGVHEPADRGPPGPVGQDRRDLSGAPRGEARAPEPRRARPVRAGQRASSAARPARRPSPPGSPAGAAAARALVARPALHRERLPAVERRLSSTDGLTQLRGHARQHQRDLVPHPPAPLGIEARGCRGHVRGEDDVVHREQRVGRAAAAPARARRGRRPAIHPPAAP